MRLTYASVIRYALVVFAVVLGMIAIVLLKEGEAEFFVGAGLLLVCLPILWIANSVKSEPLHDDSAAEKLHFDPPNNSSDKISQTVFTIIIAILAGVVWTFLSIFGSEHFLLSGWLLVVIATALFIWSIWSTKPKDSE